MMVLIIALVLVPMLLRKQITSLFKKPIMDDAYMFQDFVCNDFFVAENYEALHPLNAPGEIIPDDSPLPDFRFKQISSAYEFCVAVKFSSTSTNGEIKWCDEQRFLFLKQFTAAPLFVMIGFGGPAHFPDHLYLISIGSLSSNVFEPNSDSKYLISYKDHNIDFTRY